MSPNFYLNMYKPGLKIQNMFMSSEERFDAPKNSLVPDFFFIVIAVVILAIVFLLPVILLKFYLSDKQKEALSLWL